MTPRPKLALPLLVALGLAACGESPAPTVPTVPSLPPVASAFIPREPAPDLSPVPPPDDLVATVQVAHPRATARRILDLLGSQGWLSALGGDKLDVAELVSQALGAPVGGLLDLDQPVDVAVSHLDLSSLDPRVVASAVVSDPAAARETLEKYFKLVPGKAGAIHLQPRDDAPEGTTAHPCLLAPTKVGVTRLVCGETEEALGALAPYVLRTMPTLTSTHDLRIEAFARHLGRGHDDAPASNDDGEDPVAKVLTDLAEWMSHDVDRFVLELTLDASVADLAMSATFSSPSGAASPGTVTALTRALVGQAPPSARFPPMFDRLPRDTEMAWAARGTSSADLAPVRDVLFTALRESLAQDGYAPAQIDAQMEPVERLFVTGGPWMLASGHATQAAAAALAAYVAGKSTPATREKARLATSGWVLGEVDEPSQPWVDGLKAMARLDAVRPAGKPTKKHKAQEEKRTVQVAPVPAALGLPAGTLHLAFHVTRNPAWAAEARKTSKKPLDPFVPHDEHVFVVPDGGSTWFAIADDPALAASEVRASLSGAAPGGTLASRHDLDELRARPVSSGGFTSIAGLAQWLAGGKTDEGLRRTQDLLAGLAAMKDGGNTPVTMWTTSRAVERGAVNGGTLGFDLVVPVAVVSDAARSAHKIF